MVLLTILRIQCGISKFTTISAFIKGVFNFNVKNNSNSTCVGGSSNLNIKTFFINYFNQTNLQVDKNVSIDSSSNTESIVDEDNDQVLSAEDYSAINAWYYKSIPTMYNNKSMASMYFENYVNDCTVTQAKKTMNRFYERRNSIINDTINAALTDVDENIVTGDINDAGDDNVMEVDNDAANSVLSKVNVHWFDKFITNEILAENYFEISHSNLCRDDLSKPTDRRINAKLIQNVLNRYTFDDFQASKCRINYDISSHEFNMRFVTLIVSWFLRMGPNNLHKDFTYFKFIETNRRLLYGQFRLFIHLFNNNERFAHSLTVPNWCLC